MMLSEITENFMREYGLRVPIVQAPTGSIAGPELAIAVANAGAMAALALTWTPAEEAARLVRQVRAGTDGPFLANFALAFPPDSLDAALDAGVPIVTFSWGDAAPYVERVHAAGAKVGIQVTNMLGAYRAVHFGADFLVCQGVEAGGHVQSNTKLAEILPRIVNAANGVPVIAAGGIATGEQIAAVLKNGAAASLGTRFVATQESRAHCGYKGLLRSSETADTAPKETALTVCFQGGWPYAAHRVLRNGALDVWEAAGSPPVGQRPGEGEIIARTASGEPIFRYDDTAPRQGMSGDIAAMCLYAGTGVGAITDIPPAAELIARLWEDAQKAGALSGEANQTPCLPSP